MITDQPNGSNAFLFPSVMFHNSLSVSLSGTVRAYLVNMFSKFAGTKLHVISKKDIDKYLLGFMGLAKECPPFKVLKESPRTLVRIYDYSI
jgi:hypothetical protein